MRDGVHQPSHSGGVWTEQQRGVDGGRAAQVSYPDPGGERNEDGTRVGPSLPELRDQQQLWLSSVVQT